MGLIITNEPEPGLIMGIWKITEEFDELHSYVSLLEAEEEIVNNFQSKSRKLEWLSVRALVNKILNRQVSIVYGDNRKPFLNDNSYNISISHSKDLTSVLLSNNKKVGLDLEFMSHKISKIEHKFINNNEQITNNEELRGVHLYIHWCAKEALYKICDKQDINFKQNLTILPFEIEQSGKIKGIVRNRNIHEEFDLQYELMDNYSIVWCSK